MKKLSVAFVLVVASFALVACGGGGSSSSSEETATSGGGGAETGGAKEAESGGAETAVDFEANPEGALEFTTTKVTAKAGNDTIDFTNPSSVGHDVAIEDSSGKTVAETEIVAEGSDSTTAELKPGTYTFFCTVPGHRQAGMEGTLTVK
jgi:plastocyanin